MSKHPPSNLTISIFFLLTITTAYISCSNDRLTENFLKTGNNAEKSGAKLPNWDIVKNADTVLLRNTLHGVKNDKSASENEVDKLYSKVCSEFIAAENEAGVSQSTIIQSKKVYCNKLSVNVGDHLIDLDLGKAIIWNMADYLTGRKLNMKLDSFGVSQLGASQNDGFIKSFGDMKTRCWKKDSDCSPSSKAKRNRSFINKYDSLMK